MRVRCFLQPPVMSQKTNELGFKNEIKKKKNLKPNKRMNTT